MNINHGNFSRRAFCLTLATIASLGSLTSAQPAASSRPAAETAADHSAWLTGCITRINTLKVGMTRQDVEKVLLSEYGFYPRTWQRFVYPDCRAIKIDIYFQPGKGESPSDKIIAISKPVLDLSPVPL